MKPYIYMSAVWHACMLEIESQTSCPCEWEMKDAHIQLPRKAGKFGLIVHDRQDLPLHPGRILDSYNKPILIPADDLPHQP